MAWAVNEVNVWAASIQDRPGGLAEKLDALASAGTNLEFVIARRRPTSRGPGLCLSRPLRAIS